MSVVIVLAMSCSPHQQSPANVSYPYRIESPVEPRGTLLSQLKANRDFVLTVPAGVPAQKWGPEDVSGLLQSTRSEIEKELGAPDSSSSGEDLAYYFYRLPPGWPGGGAELHIAYSSDGRCTKASWVHSQ